MTTVKGTPGLTDREARRTVFALLREMRQRDQVTARIRASIRGDS